MTTFMTFSAVEEREVGRLGASPLRLVLLQARTVPVLAFEQAAEVQRLVDALDGRWAVTDRQANREVTVQLGPGGVQQQAGVPETVWVLTAADGLTRAAVSASSVAVESDRYDEWDRFHADAIDVFGAVQRVAAPGQCTRLGLRYINELRDERASGDPQRLAELLNPALIAPALALARPLVGSLAELRVAEDAGAVLGLRHGLTQPGVYLLDLDAYREQPEPFDAEALVARATAFHARIESVFAWALDERYLDELRAAPAEEEERA
jgi:uncharacterized protein (TIGR04255 family)